MITATGTDILGKFLTGQTSSFASHIALGCYPTPITTTLPGNKTELNFEMARFPIISRGQKIESVEQSILAIVVDANITVTYADNIYYAGQTIILTGVPLMDNGLDPAVSVNNTYTIQSIDYANKKFVLNNNVGGNDSRVAGAIDLGRIISNQKRVIYTAEIPTNNRYIVNEFGLYPSATNSASNGTDSRMLVNFTQSEAWQYVNASTQAYSSLTNYTVIADSAGNITVSDQAFFTNADNSLFDVSLRDYQRPRFLDDTVIVSGNLSNFTAPLAVTTTSNYIQISNFGVNLDKNSPADEIKIACSLVNKAVTPVAVPKSLNIMLEFLCSNGTDSARYHFRYSSGYANSSIAIYNDMYRILSVKLGDPRVISESGIIGTVSGSGPYTATITGLNVSNLEGLVVGSVITATPVTAGGSLGTGTVTVTAIPSNSSITVSSTAAMTAGTITNLSTSFSSITSGFKWRDVYALKIYSSVETATDYSAAGTSDYQIMLDAIRFENKSNTNPLYGLVAYTNSNTSQTIIKKSGETSMVEFKIGLGMQDGIY